MSPSGGTINGLEEGVRDRGEYAASVNEMIGEEGDFIYMVDHCPRVMEKMKKGQYY